MPPVYSLVVFDTHRARQELIKPEKYNQVWLYGKSKGLVASLESGYSRCSFDSTHYYIPSETNVPKSLPDKDLKKWLNKNVPEKMRVDESKIPFNLPKPQDLVKYIQFSGVPVHTASDPENRFSAAAVNKLGLEGIFARQVIDGFAPGTSRITPVEISFSGDYGIFITL